MATPATVEDYLAALPPEQRAALEHLRGIIRAALPDATEVISYQMPAVRHEGRIVVWYAGFKDHCSLFPASDAVVTALGEGIGSYLSGRGTIRFTVEAPLPDDLVRRIVEVRVAENAAARAR
jgi:uncharacterized protein YdhG (YjbR/CyaY superfamily)